MALPWAILFRPFGAYEQRANEVALIRKLLHSESINLTRLKTYLLARPHGAVAGINKLD
jgi:hypothetical protein